MEEDLWKENEERNRNERRGKTRVMERNRHEKKIRKGMGRKGVG